MNANPSDLVRNRVRSTTWLLGTAAAGAAATAEAETVQIDLIGNGASITSGILDDHSYRDLTGDGINDLVGITSLSFWDLGESYRSGIRGSVAGRSVSAFFTSSSYNTFVADAGFARDVAYSPTSARNFLPVIFTDARINGGAPTEACIEVLARNINENSHEIQLVRLVFDDANTEIQNEIALDTPYPRWTFENPPAPNPPQGNGNAAKLRLRRQIAALARLLRDARAKAHDKPRAPRSTHVGLNPEAVQYLLSLERRLDAHKRRLRRL